MSEASIKLKNVFDELAFKSIVTALLGMEECDYPQKLDKPSGEWFPMCPFCHEQGLFAVGNGGIQHTTECAIALAARLSSTYIPSQDTDG